MKIVFFGNGVRGYECLRALTNKKYEIVAIVCNNINSTGWLGDYNNSTDNQWEIFYPENPNSDEFADKLSMFSADLFVLAGYSKIIKRNIIDLPKLMTINLHGGKLPKYRGSSPMNWALINGEKEFTLSVIKVDSGVDTGDVLIERTFELNVNSTINELHNLANINFPEMVLEVISIIENSNLSARKQIEENSSYYPLRFSEDGFIVWDMYSAEQIHNRIRALTKPYPCAFTYFRNKKVILVKSELLQNDYFGESGRIFKISKDGIYICASDKCLLIKEAYFEDTGEPLQDVIKRYEKLVTVREQILKSLSQI